MSRKGREGGKEGGREEGRGFRFRLEGKGVLTFLCSSFILRTQPSLLLFCHQRHAPSSLTPFFLPLPSLPPSLPSLPPHSPPCFSQFIKYILVIQVGRFNDWWNGTSYSNFVNTRYQVGREGGREGREGGGWGDGCMLLFALLSLAGLRRTLLLCF